ncbi:MAG: pilin [Woeseiaceae bacterium]|nr:pilin [Woeseiaceae bacterium]
MSTEEQSIYSAPDSDTSVASSDNLMAAYVGPKRAEYYAARFRNVENGQSVSWHWPAFFISSAWFLYRKMWLMALGYWIGLPVALTVIQLILTSLVSAEAGSIAYFVPYLIIAFVLVPMYANKLYYNHVSAKVQKINQTDLSYEQKSEELARKGGTSIVAYFLILIPLIGFLAAIAIPAYQDYTIRAQVSEGLSLAEGVKSAVVEYVENNQDWPADNEAAGLSDPSQISGSFVQSVAIEDGNVVITYGGQASSLIQSSELVLTATADGGVIEWSCYSDEIEAKWLPAACR